MLVDTGPFFGLFVLVSITFPLQEMRLLLLLVSSSLLLAGVDGHGAVVWPPNWQDGQAIPLDERSL